MVSGGRVHGEPLRHGQARQRRLARCSGTARAVGWFFINKLTKARHAVDPVWETGENVAEQFGFSRA